MKGFLNPKGRYKKFARKLFSNKLASRGGFGVLALGIFSAILATPRPAEAFLGDIIGNAIFEILVGAMLGITSVIFSIVMLIVNSLVYTAVWIMRYVVEFAINLSINFAYTSGPIFNAGWPVLRDLANMGLILILVGIGVGTMLNLKLNKSRLPMFFLVALLINLTPIITGVIIDFSNIIANVFFVSAKNALSAAVGNSPIDYAVRHGQSIIDNVTGAAKDGLFSMAVMGNIIMPIMATVVGVVLIFIFGLLSALFLARIVALLILVILSPVAFLGLIFGGGKWKKTLWDNWWDNFIKWSIIVIPLIFFLWLGGIFFNASPDLCNPENNTLVDLGVSPELQEATGLADVVDPDGTSVSSPLDVFICQTSVTFFAITAMVVGVMISFKSSAAGAGVIINRAKSIQKAAKKKSRQSAGKYARRAAGPIAAQGGRQLGNTGLARNKFLGAPIRNVARRLQAPVDQLNKEVKGYEQKFKNMNDFSQIRSSLYAGGDEGLAAMRVASDKFTDEFATEFKGSEKLQKNLQVHQKRSQITQDKLTEDIEKRLVHTLPSGQKRKMISKFTYGDVAKLSSESLRDGEVMRAVLENNNIRANALFNSIKNKPERRSALQDGLGEMRRQADPTNRRTYGDVLNDIDKQRIENGGSSISGSIVNSPLLSAALKTKRDYGMEENRQDLSRQAKEQITKIEEEQKEIDKQIETHVSRLNDEGLILPDSAKKESKEKLEELRGRKAKLEGKLNMYKKTAGRKEPNSKYAAKNTYDTRAYDIEDRLKQANEEAKEITRKLRDDDTPPEERDQLLDRQAELHEEIDNLQNEK